MEYLDKKKIQEDNTSDYSDDEQSNDIDYDTILFESPVKNKDKLYIAHLEEKIVIELDNLDVFEIIEENDKQFVFFNLDLDNEDQEELIELLYNLDEVALDRCFEHSLEWFNQDFTEEQIENLYIPLYIDNYKHKNHILMKVEINPDIDIASIKHSSVNSIEIKGLIFYKKTFVYHVYLDKVIEDSINIQTSIEDVQKKTTETVNIQMNIEDVQKKTTETVNIQTNLEEPEHTYNVSRSEVSPEIILHTSTESELISDHTKLDIQQRIEKQRLLVQEKFSKSEQINKDAESLRIQAIQSANELKQLELELELKL